MASTPRSAPELQFATDLRFRLNGAEVVLETVDPTVLLVDWLRSPAVALTGTKKVCAQGGCGACTVMLSRWNDTRQQVEHLAINSCLHPMAALDGVEITTTEGTGSSLTELSPVQFRVAKENGSQCGFCTPGFVMNMHSLLAANQGQALSQKQIEDAFDGNLCRCTGYRSILYGMKHFASDWGPEDEKGCLRTVIDPAEKVAHTNVVYAPSGEGLKNPPRALHYSKGGYEWYRPVALGQVHAILHRHAGITDIKFVGGNTSIGVYDRFVEDPHLLIDISQIAELQGVRVTDAGLYLGASTSYATLVAELTALAETKDQRTEGIEALLYMAGRTAGTVVRNAATLSGNTMLVVRHIVAGEPFPSDLFTALSSLGATVRVSLDTDKTVELTILDFARDYQSSPDLQRGVLVNYLVPWTKPQEYARTYKTALREVNAHSIVNAGLRVRFNVDGTVADAAVVLGGIGPVAFHASATETSLIGKDWTSATLTLALAAIRLDVEANLRDNQERMSGLPYEGFTDEYKLHLAESYLYQFFLYVAERIAPGTVPADVASAGSREERPVSKGKQSYEKDVKEYPVNLPVVKIGAFLQASGEAKYTHDLEPERAWQAAAVTSASALADFSYCIPSDSGAQPASLEELIAHLQSLYPGFRDFVTASDIPKGCSNGSTGDPLFAEGQVINYGQCIGLVLAHTETLATDIAQFISTACIQYAAPAGGAKPILSIDEAVRQNSIFEDCPGGSSYPVHIWKIERAGSDFSWQGADATVDVDGIPCKVVRGRQSGGSQLHFYMESQSCVAVPGERNEITVFPSSQSPDAIHSGIRSTLGLPANQIDVQIQRVGGGYGGKTTRSPYIASAAAVAAKKHHRPVRLVVRRENDSAMVGHRHPLRGEYQIAIATGEDDADRRGLLLGLHTDFLADGGSTYDCSFVVMDCIQLRADSAYNIPNYGTSGDVCKTNKASNTAMRSMGLIQAILVQEDAIEKAAREVGMTAEEVRGKNLYRMGDLTPFGQVVDYCYLDKVWERIGRRSDFARRLAEVERFNRANKWTKRGISMIPVKYASGYNATFLEQAGALVEVYDQDGTVLVRHGGVEIGQGLITKVGQIAARELNVPLELIGTTGTDTQIVPNPISTGASTGTGYNGGAVMKACRTLRNTLETYCLKLLRENGPEWCQNQGINFWDYAEGWRATDPKTKKLIWNNIISQAYSDRVDLSAQDRFKQQGGKAIDTGLIFKPIVVKLKAQETVNQFTGFTFSAACTEVEIDVLTGETTVLRADLVYDMGDSLNPAVDIGQVEGAYVQGLGYVLTEDVVFQPDGANAGTLNSDNTWRYKVPATTTIPLEFNVDLFPRSDAPDVPDNPYDLLSSKEVGEPPLVLAASAFFAVKRAILAAREDRGHSEWFELEAPATVQRVREACLVDAEDLQY